MAVVNELVSIEEQFSVENAPSACFAIYRKESEILESCRLKASENMAACKKPRIKKAWTNDRREMIQRGNFLGWKRLRLKRPWGKDREESTSHCENREYLMLADDTCLVCKGYNSPNRETTSTCVSHRLLTCADLTNFH